ncbi:cobalamin biosynthesis protein CobG [Streptomyces qinzhouensis]
MLAAMSTAPVPPSSQATAVSRDRGDACPGTLKLHEADDGALARVRVPGGVLSTAQARALSAIARRLGDGELHLTSRGNVQLRGLRAGCGAELAAALAGAGLLPSPEHERVRNVVASPLSGLDGRGVRELRPWLTALDAALCASPAARALSGRFLFALDDGRGDMAALGADVTVRAVSGGAGDALIAAGAADRALRIAGDDAPRAALLIAEAFLRRVRESGARVWRIAELDLPPGESLRWVRGTLADHGIGSVPERWPDGPYETGAPPPGITGSALCVQAPLGRLTAAQWQEATDAAEGELRLTPWRGLVVPVPGLSAAAASAALGGLARTGLVTDPASPWLRTGACIGRPGCAKSRSDVRADAIRGLAAAGRSRLPLYWSGCERRCGRPPGDRIDVVAAPDGGYRLTGTAAGQPPRTASLDHPDQLAGALAAITP